MSESSDSELFDVESKLEALWGTQGGEGVVPQTGVQFGQMIGPYQVRAFLGAGSFGLVYLADEVETKRPVALKLPRIEVLLDKEKRKRFRVEADIIGQLNHPGIVRILRSDVDESAMPYIACDWCTGPDVAAYLDELRASGQGLPTWEESVRLMAEVCDAIHFAHEQGITHRDIKPANIILHRDIQRDEQAEGLDRFVARITDFGLARLADPVETTTRTGVVLGTPAYMAPERILAGLSADGEAASHSESVHSDIYSLGGVLFELLTGSPPAKSKSWLELIRMERKSTLNSELVWAKDVPPALRTITETCLRHHHWIRYRSAGDLGDDLRRLSNGEAPVGRPIGVAGRLGFWFTSQDWITTAGWFAIVSQTIFAVWMMLGDVFKVSFGLLTPEEYFAMLPMLLAIALRDSATVILAGVFCVKRKWWAAWVGACLAGYNLYAPVMAFLGEPQMFPDIYEANNPYFSFFVHLINAIIVFMQLVLFVFAIASRFFDTPQRRDSYVTAK